MFNFNSNIDLSITSKALSFIFNTRTLIIKIIFIESHVFIYILSHFNIIKLQHCLKRL